MLHRPAKFYQDHSRHSLMHADPQSFVSFEKQDAEPTTDTSRLTKQMLQREVLIGFDLEPTHRSLRTAFCVHSGAGRSGQSLSRESPRAHRKLVGMLRFMSDINQPSLPTPFYAVLVSISVFTALSTVFHSINSPDNSSFPHSVLPVLSLPNRSFQ